MEKVYTLFVFIAYQAALCEKQNVYELVMVEAFAGVVNIEIHTF